MGRLRRVSSVVISVSLAFFALGGVATLLFNRPSSSWKMLNVTTGSMRPKVPPGSLVFVHRVPEASLQVGDVITFTSPKDQKEMVTHRIVEKTLIDNVADGFVTKGDANPLSDPQPVIAGNVVGRTAFSIPFLGKVLSWTHTIPGLIILIDLPALLIIMSEFKKLKKYFKEQQPYIVSRAWFVKRYGAPNHTVATVAACMAIVVIFLAGGFVVAKKATAAPGDKGEKVTDTVSLSPNTLSVEATNPNPGTGLVLIRRVDMLCSLRNTATTSKAIVIALYNPGTSRVDISGWTIQSANGVVVTLPRHASLAGHATRTLITRPANGVTYAGDFLALVDTTNTEADGLSWGSNTSRLNPPLPAANGGFRMKRVNPTGPVPDTNTAADWFTEQRLRCTTGTSSDISGILSEDIDRALDDASDGATDSQPAAQPQLQPVDQAEIPAGQGLMQFSAEPGEH